MESFLVSLVGMVDTFMVSSLGVYAIAAVGLTTQPKFIGLAVFISLNVAVSAIVARRKGEGNRESANKVLQQALLITGGLLVVVSTLCVAFADPILHLAGSQPDTHRPAVTYFRIVMGGMAFNVVSMVINAAQRGAGNTRISLTTNLVSNLVNVVFDYLLIGGHFGFPALGVAGAAIATVISQIVSCVVGFWYMRSRYELLRFSVRELRLDRTAAGRVLKIGAPMAIQQSIVSCGFLFLQKLVNLFGESMIASYTVATRMENILMIPIIGIQNTMATFAGQNMGARQPERVSKGLGQGVLVSLFMTAALCVCQLLGMELIIRAFKLDAAAAAICRQHLFASVLSEPIFAIYFPANGMFQGVGEGFHATFYALMALGLRVVFAYSLYRTAFFGYTAIWWSQAMAWSLTLITCYAHFFRGKWKEKSLVS